MSAEEERILARLYEYQSKLLLKQAGIPVPEGEAVRTPDEAGAAAERLGCPVVLKIQVWVTEDEYKKQMGELEKGEHLITMWVIKNEFKGKKVVAKTKADGTVVAEEKEVWMPKRLSRGHFVYVVP